MQKYVNLIAFLQKLISKELVLVIMEVPRLDSSLKIYCKGSNNESNQTIPCQLQLPFSSLEFSRI